MTKPRFALARAFKFASRSSGNLTLNSTSFANVDTGLDLVLAAEVGDVIEVGVSVVMGAEAVIAMFDVYTIVSASPVTGFGGTNGVSGWYVSALADNMHVGGSVMSTLVAGDISSGTVTLRLRYKTGTAANKTLLANTANPLHFWAKNLGPADPH